MSKKMLIDATHAEETRVVVVDGNKVEEFDFETLSKRQLAGNIYLAKVTRVEPSLQAAFVEYGGNRHGFLAFAEIHPDYYQIPVADRKALLDEERALARAEDEEESRPRRRGPRAEPKPERAENGDAVRTGPSGPSGMDLVDLGDEAEAPEPGVTDRPVADHHSAPDNAHEDGHDHSHGHENRHAHDGEVTHNGNGAYHAIDHASDTDDEIESVAEEDVAEEIRSPRKPRARRYKIQEVIKVRQIMLVQVVKEERGSKGAALTTYLSLAGRYCVLMPNTARGGGISRKITQAADRKKLKEIAGEIEVPEGAGLIIRTAGAKRTKPEIKRDYEYLMRLWEQIRELTMKSIAPAAIYEEGDLIKRSIRDLYSREIDEVLVEGEAGYRTAKDFMRMIMPSHARLVQRYADTQPLFAKFGVESYLASMFNPVVQLKSGGYIVIGVTEALVAVDVNSGRATKEGSIEDTALKTNLEAAEEVARQLRLRDLAGLIVIDFIDMEERKNNLAVEKRMKDKLKTDRARIQVGRISGFGLLEMSRQRLRPGMLESTTQPCPSCHGTGLIRSDDSMALSVLRALEEEGTRKRSKEVLLKAPIGIVNFLINNKREHIALIELRYGMSVRIEADPMLISPNHSIEKFKTATRVVHEAHAAISGNASLMGAPVDDFDDEDPVEEMIEDEIEVEVEDDADEGETLQADRADGGAGGVKKRRRRRRRRKGGREDNAVDGATEGGDDVSADGTEEDDGEEEDASAVVATGDATEAPIAQDGDATPAKTTRSRSRGRRGAAKTPAVLVEPEAEAEPLTPMPFIETAAEIAPDEAIPDVPAEEPKPKKRASRAKPKVAVAAEAMPVDSADVIAEAAPAFAETPAPAPEPAKVEVAAQPAPEPEPEPEMADDPAKPKRKGWWSLGR